MPPLTLQEEGLTKGTSCPSHCPMSGEKFIVFSALCFCLSCCLLLVYGFLLLVLEDENLLFAEIESIQDNPSQ